MTYSNLWQNTHLQIRLILTGQLHPLKVAASPGTLGLPVWQGHLSGLPAALDSQPLCMASPVAGGT